MRKKEIINPDPGINEKYTFSPAVRKGNMLFISGTDAAEKDPVTGKEMIKGNLPEQADVIYKKLESILKAAGATFEDVVWTTDYITTMKDYRATAEIRRRYFKEDFPASTGIVVKGLVHKGALIEIDAVAILD